MKQSLLYVLIALSFLCTQQQVFAAIASGSCGSNLTWILSDEGVLNISGTGAMDNWNNASAAPWNIYRTDIKEVSIDNTVTSIGDSAFCGCTAMTSITIPASVTAVGSFAFDKCTGLKKVAISDIDAWCNISFANYTANPCAYAHKLYLNGEEVKYLTISDAVSRIGDYTFADCSSLKSVTIPNSVKSIGKYAFHDCLALSSVAIGNAVTSIGDDAFSWCIGLTSCILPSTVTSLGKDAFAGCSGLTSAYIPKSVTSIGSGAFSACTDLISVKVEEGNTIYDSRENCNAIIETATHTLVAGCMNTVIPSSVTSLSEYAFSGCTELTSVTIPNAVSSIGDYAFSGCAGLTSMRLPAAVSNLGKGAFFDCSALKSVNIPEAITNIDKYTFAGCSGLTSIIIPGAVTSIEDYAFYECSGLSSIAIPQSVASIGNLAFKNCTGLTTVTSEAMVPPVVQSYTFEDSTYMNATLKVHAAVMETYQDADFWKNFQAVGHLPLTIDECSNVTYMNDTIAILGTKMTVPVILKNSDPITALQFDVVFPDGVTIAQNDEGNNLIEICKERSANGAHIVETYDKGNGCTRVMVYSDEDVAFTGNDGAVLNMTLNIASGMSEGEFPVTFKNIVLSKADFDVVEVDSIASKLNVMELLPGDVNTDGNVNVGDLTILVNMIMSNYSTQDLKFKAVDMNGDGILNVGDISLLVREIMMRAKAFMPMPEEDLDESIDD